MFDKELEIYTVEQITEADFGCEETGRNEPYALLLLNSKAKPPYRIASNKADFMRNSQFIILIFQFTIHNSQLPLRSRVPLATPSAFIIIIFHKILLCIMNYELRKVFPLDRFQRVLRSESGTSRSA